MTKIDDSDSGVMYFVPIVGTEVQTYCDGAPLPLYRICDPKVRVEYWQSGSWRQSWIFTHPDDFADTYTRFNRLDEARKAAEKLDAPVSAHGNYYARTWTSKAAT